MTGRNAQCERARGWISLGADGELSELEQALLDAHLGRCPGCRQFQAGVSQVEAFLRGAPLERPSRPVRVRNLRSSGRSLRILQAGAAAAVVATAALGALVADVFHTTSETSSAPRLQRVSDIGDESLSSLRELRRMYLVSDSRRTERHILFP